MPRWRQPLRHGLVLAAAVALTGEARAVPDATAARTQDCRSDYLYAGVENEAPRSGVRAEVTMLDDPAISAGQTGGWVGVGGPGLGPGGTDEWIQIGFAGFQSGERQLYYEVTQPGKATRYHMIRPSVAVGETFRLSVLEVAGASSHWRVWVGGRPVSPAILLPRSHGRFQPQAMGEAWNAGTNSCNVYAYRFASLREAGAPGGSWRATREGSGWRSVGYEVVRRRADTFDSRPSPTRTIEQRSAAVPDPASSEPPLLGTLARRLAGRDVAVDCAGDPGRAVSWLAGASTLKVRADVCQVLLGYAVAHPWAPSARSKAGGEVLARAFAFTRGVAAAAGLRGHEVACRAGPMLQRLLRGLGATGDMARALHARLLAPMRSGTPRAPLGRSSPAC